MAISFKKEFGFWQLVVVLAMLALFGLMLVYGLQPQTFDSRLKKAEKLWKSKKYDEAISVYLSAIEKDPQNPKVPDILLQVGDIYNISLNQMDKAVQTYNLLSVRYPASDYALQAFIKKGEIYFGSDQFDKALKEYQNILENFPNIKDREVYRLRMGISHLKLKQYEAARREFKKILDNNLKTSLADQVLFHTANSYFLEGSPSLAIPIYQSIIQNYPKSTLVSEAKFNMADCYESMEEFDKALVIYDEIKTTYPNPKVIEWQIEKNKERKVEAEKRKAKMLLEQKKMLESRKATENIKPTSPPSGISDKVRKDIIRDIYQNYK